jgi:hypothetical protein
MMRDFAFLMLILSGFSLLSAQVPIPADLYNVTTTLDSRAATFENPSGERGAGGHSASHLGIGRKGSPARLIEAGETVTLLDASGSGTVHHIWMTGEWTNFSWLADSSRQTLLRSTVIRAYLDNQASPSIECPLGDLMGFAHAKFTSYQSAVHSIGSNGAFNLWLPMPFTKHARITLSNESQKSFTLFYQIDYTLNDPHPQDVGRLHVSFRRENPTTLLKDFEVMPKRIGKGRFIGAVLGIRALEDSWWGEGEIKVFKDGDTTFPTICGTGSEDYIGLSYGMQETTFLYHGCSLNRDWSADTGEGFVSMYRWHILDPIYWQKECSVTIQQIGWNNQKSGLPNSGLYERRDDWSAAAFWYEPIPSAPLPPLPSVAERTAFLAK